MPLIHVFASLWHHESMDPGLSWCISVHRDVTFYIPGELCEVYEQAGRIHEDPCHRAMFFNFVPFWCHITVDPRLLKCIMCQETCALIFQVIYMEFVGKPGGFMRFCTT